jgi:hypothetical protein
MNLFLKKSQKHFAFRLSLRACCTGIGFSLLKIIISEKNTPISTMLSDSLYIYNVREPALCIFMVLPLIVIGFPLMQLFCEDIEISGLYVLTRLKSRQKWYLGNAFALMICTFFTLLSYITSSAVTLLLLWKDTVPFKELLYLAGLLLFFGFMFSAFMFLFINILSLYIPVSFAFILYVLIIFASAFASASNNDVLQQLNIINNYLLQAHQNIGSYLTQLSVEFETPKALTLQFSAVYFTIINAMTLLSGLIITKRMDFSLIKGGLHFGKARSENH